MAYRTLELTLISAKDLKDVNLISKMDVYALVSLSGDTRSQQRSPVDRDGGRNPAWNATLKFTVPADAGAAGSAVLHILLRAARALGDRDVGEIHVPLKELLASVSGDGPTQKQFVSYQVRKPCSGKAKGVINISYKFSERITAPGYGAGTTPLAGYPPATKPANTGSPATAYPLAATAASAPYLPPPAGYPPQSAEKPPKTAEPVTAYPAASSSTAPYPPPPPQYAAPPPYGYPPQPGYGYAPPPPPQPGYGYAPPPPPQPGYGYPPAAGYGYPPTAQPQKKKNNFGLGLGAGLLGGALGGLILGDIVSDQAYDAGYDAGFDNGGFDGGF